MTLEVMYPGEQFQSELPANTKSGRAESSSGKFFKSIVKIILIIGVIIMVLPVLAVIICLAILLLFSLGFTIPLLKVMGTGTIFLAGFTLINNKGISKKYIPLLVFSLIFSLLFIAGQYDVQSFNCPLHNIYSLTIMPILQFIVSIIVFLGFFYNGFISIKKPEN